MKAIVCRAFAPIDELRCERIREPSLGSGTARIAIKAAGMNFPEVLKAEGRHQVRPHLPWIPGSEVSGVVTEVASGLTRVGIGDRVMGLAAATGGGGYAEQIVLPEAKLFTLPDSVSYEDAAAIPIVYGTSLYALRQRARIQPGEALLVLGAAGGVGLAAVQLGALMGARVIAAASTPAKRELAIANGAAHAVDYTQPDWRNEVKALNDGQGVDVVYDPVGGDAFDEAVRAIGPWGRYLVVGFAAGRIPTLKMNMPLVKTYDILGVRLDVWHEGWWDDARANLEQLLTWCQQGHIRPIVSAKYPLERAVEALHSIYERKTTGKIVLIND
jgi:NADPH2:quinone reductase